MTRTGDSQFQFRDTQGTTWGENDHRKNEGTEPTVLTRTGKEESPGPFRRSASSSLTPDLCTASVLRGLDKAASVKGFYLCPGSGVA